MDNDESSDEVIALSTLEEQSFDECNEIVIEDDDESGEINTHCDDDNHVEVEDLVLDIADNNVTESADLYPQQDALEQISIDVNEDVPVNNGTGGEHFMLNTVEELKEVLEDYYERTSTRFVGWRKTKNFGMPSSECALSGHQVQWCDTVRNTNNGLDNLVPFDGIPYMIVGHYDMDCQFGNDRNASGKAKRQQKKAAGLLNTRTHHFTQPTKRCGCPAKISVKQIIRFPEFKIDKDSVWRKKSHSAKLKAKLKECREEVKMEVFIVGKLPEISEHKHHESVKGTEAVLQELIILAQELYLEEKTYSQIQQSLQQYVLEDLYWNKQPPHRSRRKFYPTLRDIRYFCTRGLQLLRFTDDEQEYIRKIISDIESQGNVNVSFILTEGKMMRNDENASLLEESEKADYLKKLTKKNEEKKVQSFLFCNQTDSQRRLLKRYNNVAYLIEVVSNLPSKNTLTYKMYNIIIQTNVDYQVAGCITVSKQKKDGLSDGLKLFREWNPTWNPRYFMVDCSQTIYEAVSGVFPECQYFLNPQSCEQKWYEFFNKPLNNLQEHADEIMNYLKTMQYSLTEDSLSVAAALLEASDIWQNRDNLREWFQNSWLPLAKQWVFGYRPEDLMILQHLKASIDDCVLVYKGVLRQASKFKGFMEMIEKVSCIIPSMEYEKYVERNKKAYVFYNHYSKTTKLPEYLKNVPIPLLPYIEGVCKLAESTNFSITRDNYDAFTAQYNQLDEVMSNVEETHAYSNWSENNDGLNEDGEQTEFVITQKKVEERSEMEISETEFGWIEYSNKILPGENTISFGDSYSHPFCTCSHWLLYRLPCVHIVSVFYRIPGWKYDMMSPLYRASPLIEIDCSSISFPINDPKLSLISDKQSQTEFNTVTTETQTINDEHCLEDNVFEVPSKIWDYFIILTQTKDFLRHLDKMAFLFKDKNIHRKFRQQVERIITKLESDSLKNKGQKIEFTTRNVLAPRQTKDEHNALKISSLNLENIQRSGEPKKIIKIISDGTESAEEMITGIYKLNNDGMKPTNNNSSKTMLLHAKKNDAKTFPVSTSYLPGSNATSVEKQNNISYSLIRNYNSQSEVLLSTKTFPTNTICNHSIFTSDTTLLGDTRNSSEVANRKRKIIDFECENVTNSNVSETNVSESNVSGSDVSGSNIDFVNISIANQNLVTSNNTPIVHKKKELLSVLNYLPLLSKTISPKQVISASTTKITSKIDLLRYLPPNVGLTRACVKNVSTSVVESQTTDPIDDVSTFISELGGLSPIQSLPLQTSERMSSFKLSGDRMGSQKIIYKETKPD